MKKIILFAIIFGLISCTPSEERRHNLRNNASIIPSLNLTDSVNIRYLGGVHGEEDPIANGFSIYLIKRDSIEYVLVNTSNGVSIIKSK